MGVRFPSGSSVGQAPANPATNVETVCLFTSPLIPSLDGALVFLFWYVALTLGTGTTALAVRIRRGITTAGTLLNNAPAQTGAAGNLVLASGCWLDQLSTQTQQQWCITLQQTAGTANGAISDAAMFALLL